MQPEEFISFKKSKPEKNKWIIVTNNLTAKDAHGEMSHVWLTTFWIKGSQEGDGLVTFDSGDMKIRNLTHWKYA